MRRNEPDTDKRPIDGGDESHDDAARETKNLAALAILLLLAVIALVLIQHLIREANIEDCLLAGRRNCDAMMENH